MTTAEEFEMYMNSAEFEEDLQLLRQSLSRRGLFESTIRDHVKFATHCEKVLGGDLDPRSATAEHRELLRLRTRGLSQRTIDRYLRAWDNLVTAVSETTSPGGPLPYWRTDRFNEDLESFRDRMLSAGSPPGFVDDTCKFVRHSLKVMAIEVGDLPPEGIDADVLEELDRFLFHEVRDNTRLRYIRALGMFVQVMTGRNPYREITVPDRQADFMRYVYDIVIGQPFEEELTLYIGAMERRGYRRSTIVDKVRSSLACLRRLTETDFIGDLADITPETIAYLWTFMDGLKESTVRVYLRNFGLFLDFVMGSNPVREADIMWNPCGDDVNRRFIFRDQWKAMMAHAEADEALILTLGATMGLRRFEIADLRFDDIRDDVVRIRGKGHGIDGKVVYKRLNPAVRKAIADYLPMRSGIVSLWGDGSDGRILVRRSIHPGEAMTPDIVGDMVRRLGLRAEVDCSTHCLRRLYATTLYDNGTDLNSLRRLMRHESVDTTLRCYIDADPRRMAAAEEALVGDLFGDPRMFS